MSKHIREHIPPPPPDLGRVDHALKHMAVYEGLIVDLKAQGNQGCPVMYRAMLREYRTELLKYARRLGMDKDEHILSL